MYPIIKCQILYARTVATIHLHFFAIQFFKIQEPGSPSVSVIFYILLIATLAGLLVSLTIQSSSLFKIIPGPLISRKEKS